MNKLNSFGANRAPVEGILFVKMKTSHSRENKGYLEHMCSFCKGIQA